MDRLTPRKSKLGQYVWNILIALDQLLNAIFGGDPGETISGRAARNSHLHHWHLLGKFLDYIDPGHMARSLEPDEGKDEVFK